MLLFISRRVCVYFTSKNNRQIIKETNGWDLTFKTAKTTTTTTYKTCLGRGLTREGEDAFQNKTKRRRFAAELETKHEKGGRTK
jgi:hypothetical protein